jgi:predicted outer membrane protein
MIICFTSCRQYSKTDDLQFPIRQDKNAILEYVERENDRQFLVNAIEIDLEGIKLGQLVQQNTQKREVKALGKMMEKIHTKSLKSLIVIANKKAIKIPIVLSNPEIEKYKKLREQATNGFDLALCNLIVMSNEDAIASFEKVSIESNDLEIFQCVMLILPTLRSSLDKSILCKRNVKNSIQVGIIL